MRIRAAIVTLALTLGISSLTQAETPSAGPDPHSVPVFQKLLEQNYVPQFWHSAADGLQTWFLVTKEGPRPFYVLPDGKHIFFGALMDGDLNNQFALDTKAIAAYYHYPVPGTSEVGVPTPSVEPAVAPAAGSSIEKAERTNWLEFGVASAPLIYIFMDPNCDYCARYWASLQPLLEQGKVRVRIIVVGILHKGDTLSAEILGSDNPNQAWRDVKDRKALPADKAKSSIAAGLPRQSSNEAFLKEIMSKIAPGYLVAPLTLYRTKAGHARYIVALPTDLPALLREAG